ncbi:hypothetical protein JCM3774_004119 [Rhodotorula dairenensis]
MPDGSRNSSHSLSLSRSVSPPRPARNPLRLHQVSGGGGGTTTTDSQHPAGVSTYGRGILGRKNSDSASSKTSSKRLSATGLVVPASWHAESRTTLPGSNPLPTWDSSFDRLLVSNATIKLSFTPDTLRDPAPSPPFIPATLSEPDPATSATRLPARAPRPRGPLAAVLDDTDEEEDDSDASLADESKAALIDIINSSPPWEASQPTPNKPEWPLRHPTSQSPESRDSSETAGRGVLRKNGAQLAGRASRVLLGRTIEAKDERRDLACERQINRELMDFFSTAPPPAQIVATATPPEQQFSASPPTLQQLVVRMTGNSRKTRRRSASRASNDFSVTGAEAAKFLPRPLTHRSRSHPSERSSLDASEQATSTGLAPTGGDPTAASVLTSSFPERIRIPTTAPHSSDRASRPSSYPRPSGLIQPSLPEEPPVQIFEEYASFTGRVATSPPTSPFPSVPRAPRPSQRSRSVSTSSAASFATFPSSTPRSPVKSKAAVLIPPVAIGSALALEASTTAPVTFQIHKRGSSFKSSSKNEEEPQQPAPYLDPARPRRTSTTGGGSLPDPPASSTTRSHRHRAPTGVLSPYLLLHLRSSMLRAQNRDECVALIDEALCATALSREDVSAQRLAYVAEYLLNTAE